MDIQIQQQTAPNNIQQHQKAAEKLQSERVQVKSCRSTSAKKSQQEGSGIQHVQNFKNCCLDGWIPPKVLFFPAGLLWLQFCGLISKVNGKWAWDKIKLRSTMGQFLQASCQAAEEGVRSSSIAQATDWLFICENDFPCFYMFLVLPVECCVMFLDVSFWNASQVTPELAPTDAWYS